MGFLIEVNLHLYYYKNITIQINGIKEDVLIKVYWIYTKDLINSFLDSWSIWQIV